MPSIEVTEEVVPIKNLVKTDHKVDVTTDKRTVARKTLLIFSNVYDRWNRKIKWNFAT